MVGIITLIYRRGVCEESMIPIRTCAEYGVRTEKLRRAKSDTCNRLLSLRVT
jgi:hypothetical protein